MRNKQRSFSRKNAAFVLFSNPKGRAVQSLYSVNSTPAPPKIGSLRITKKINAV